MKIKNLIFLVLFTTLLFSCGNDDEGTDDTMDNVETISFQNNNITYEFDTYTVAMIDENGFERTTVTASMSNSTSQTLFMGFISNELSGGFEGFIYSLDGNDCSDFQGEMDYNLSVNNDSQITGSFSGSVHCGDNNDESIISNGVINVIF